MRDRIPFRYETRNTKYENLFLWRAWHRPNAIVSQWMIKNDRTQANWELHRNIRAAGNIDERILRVDA